MTQSLAQKAREGSFTILNISSQPSVTDHCLCVCVLLGVCCHGIQRYQRVESAVSQRMCIQNEFDTESAEMSSLVAFSF
jgi:hypothetical protein